MYKVLSHEIITTSHYYVTLLFAVMCYCGLFKAHGDTLPACRVEIYGLVYFYYETDPFELDVRIREALKKESNLQLLATVATVSVDNAVDDVIGQTRDQIVKNIMVKLGGGALYQIVDKLSVFAEIGEAGVAKLGSTIGGRLKGRYTYLYCVFHRNKATTRWCVDYADLPGSMISSNKTYGTHSIELKAAKSDAACVVTDVEEKLISEHVQECTEDQCALEHD